MSLSTHECAVGAPWLGYPRKDGDRNDYSAVFSRFVQRGELPEDLDSLQRELDAG